MDDHTYIKFKPFTNIVNRRVNLTYGDFVVQNLRVNLELPYAGPGRLLGYIYGGIDEYNSICRLVSKSNGFDLKMNLTEEYDHSKLNNTLFFIRQVISPRNRDCIIAIIESYKFEILNSDFHQKIPRTVKYRIVCSNEIWHSIVNFEVEDINNIDESNRVFIGNYILYINLKKIDSDNDFRSTRYLSNENYSLVKQVYEVNIIENEITTKTNSEFIEESSLIAEDFFKLASFISQFPVEWYWRYFISENESLETYKHIEPIDFIQNSDLLINRFDVKRFLELSYPKWVQLKNSNKDFTIPVTYFANFHSLRFLEQQFIDTYICLEFLCKILTGSENNVLPESYFNKLRRKIKKIISSEDFMDVTKDFIIRKLPELNRIPIDIIIKNLLDRLEIDYRYTLNEDKYFNFLRIRNKLIHLDTKIYNNEDLDILKETYIMRGLFIKIIFKSLGWGGEIRLDRTLQP